MIGQMMRPAIVAALLAGTVPSEAVAYDISCPVQTICEGRSCHKAEAGMRLAVLVEQADSTAPVLISDAGPVPARRSRTATGWRFDGRNGFGTREVLATGIVADMTPGTFTYLREGTGAGSEITYQGTCAVVR